MRAIALLLILPYFALAEDPELGELIARHQEGSIELSDDQDELAADVQQLTIEQTAPKVIELLRQVEDAMDEASELLYGRNTGGTTIAAETEVIELIFDAAKERQKQNGGGKSEDDSSGGMLEMMERMMGREPGGQQSGAAPGDQAGEGSTGESDAANAPNQGANGGKVEERRVPKGSGTAGRGVPREFQDAMEAFNREAGKLAR